MTKDEPISASQMGVLFLSFMLGSAIINIPQPLVEAAQNGAWISILASFGLGMILLSCIVFLYRKNPSYNLVDYCQRTVGKWGSLVVSVPLLLFTLLQLSYIVMDIGGFFNNAMMRETPSYVFHFFVLFVAALTVKAGIEVMARMFVLLLCYLIFFSVIVLILTIPFYQIDHLFPVLPEGIKPVIHGFFITAGFPYGEVVTFSLLLPMVHKIKGKKRSVEKALFVALIFHIFLLLTSVLCTIMAFGPIAGSVKFSLFELARLINIKEIITRIESLIGIALVVGSYMKATIMLFILKETLAQVLNLKDHRIMIFPITVISFLLTLTMHKDSIEFYNGVFIITPLAIFFFCIIPLFIVTVVTASKG